MDVERTAAEVVDAAIQVHRDVGPGLLESAYERLLEYELTQRGCTVDRQKYLDIRYRQLTVERAYCVDLIVNESVIVEVKAMDGIAPVHIRQVLTYLKFSGLQTGFLINFGQTTIIAGGLRRIMNGYPDRNGYPGRGPGVQPSPPSVK